jgi:hypothetical protein
VQTLRSEKSATQPRRHGGPRVRSQVRHQKIYLLQGLMTCAYCGSPMSPHYVFHKAGKDRQRESFISHYVCNKYRKEGSDCDHINRVLAARAEDWMRERLSDMVQFDGVVERAVKIAQAKRESHVQPEMRVLSLNQAALAENQRQIDALMSTIASGSAAIELMDLMNQKARELKMERERLQREHRQISKALVPVENAFEAQHYRKFLGDFTGLWQSADPEQIQRLLRFVVKGVAWGSDGTHQLQLWALPKKQCP